MMLIHDITPRTGFGAYFEREIEPRRLELAERMGILKRIEVKYIGEKCNSSGRMADCKNINCSWFNHSQVGMR